MLYDYKCQDCENVQEEMHPMSGPKYKITCEECGSDKMKKVISASYIKFVGSGWDTNKNRGIE